MANSLHLGKDVLPLEERIRGISEIAEVKAPRVVTENVHFTFYPISLGSPMPEIPPNGIVNVSIHVYEASLNGRVNYTTLMDALSDVGVDNVKWVSVGSVQCIEGTYRNNVVRVHFTNSRTKT